MIERQSQARRLRELIEQAAQSLDDKKASTGVELFGKLKGDGSLIKSGTKIPWDGKLKRAAVDLWDNADSTPATAPNLWEDINYHNGIRVIPETITATLAFGENELGYWEADGKTYKAKNNGTVWTPAQYPDAWEAQ